MAKGKSKAEYFTRVVEPIDTGRFAPATDEGWFVEVEVIKPMIAKYKIIGRAGQRIQVQSSIADELVKNNYAKLV